MIVTSCRAIVTASFTRLSPNVHQPKSSSDLCGVGGRNPQMTNLKILNLIENYHIVDNAINPLA